MEDKPLTPKHGKGSWIAWLIGILAAGGVITAVINFVLPKLWPENMPPQPLIITAGVTENYVPVNKEIVFDGSKSRDPEGKRLHYQWQIDPPGPEASSEEETLRWTFSEPGEYVVRLIVKDSDGLAVSDSIIISVKGGTEKTGPPLVKTISVPAKYSRGMNKWFDTHLDVKAGSILSVTAKGMWRLGVGPRECDANGLPNFPEYRGFLYGTLLGRISATGKVFPLGKDYRGPAPSSGRLYLSNNDSNIEDNSGALQITISLSGT